MHKNLVITFMMFFPIFVFEQTVLGQKRVPVRCTGCHKRLLTVLPASHKKYNLSLCFSCHKRDGKGGSLGEKIHVAHLEKKTDAMKDCLSCHIPNRDGKVVFPSYPDTKSDKGRMQSMLPFFNLWMSSSYLDHNHRKKGIYCVGCHTNYLDENEVTETQAKCIECHGNYDELIRLTAKAPYEANPHKSHLVDLRCSVCHHGHRGFTDFCAKCHSFGFKARHQESSKNRSGNG